MAYEKQTKTRILNSTVGQSPDVSKIAITQGVKQTINDGDGQ